MENVTTSQAVGVNLLTVLTLKFYAKQEGDRKVHWQRRSFIVDAGLKALDSNTLNMVAKGLIVETGLFRDIRPNSIETEFINAFEIEGVVYTRNYSLTSQLEG